MSLSIFVDFGASRIKSALFDSKQGKFIAETDVTSPSTVPNSTGNNKFEVQPDRYWFAFEESINTLLDKIGSIEKIDGIWLCSEMHGFILSSLDGSTLTPYISWKDERASNDIVDGLSTLERLKIDIPDYHDITGMQLKAGLPSATLASILNTSESKQTYKLLEHRQILILSLIDWLLLRGGANNPKADISLLMSLGFHDIKNFKPSEAVLEKVISGKFQPIFLDTKNHITDPLGTINICGRSLSVYGGIGDFQAAIYGAGYTNNSHAIINLGTGSQIATPITSNANSELRVTIDYSIAQVISHIPCGRALNVFSRFIDQFANDCDESLFWSTWGRLTADDILSTRLNSNLCVFDAAWGRTEDQNCGWIGISESSTNFADVLAGLARSWINQYLKALDHLDPHGEIKHVLLSGGVAHKSNFLLDVFSILDPNRYYKRSHRISGEETIDGLLKYSKLDQGD